MAVSLEQLAFAQEHFETLFPDLLVFAQRHEGRESGEKYLDGYFVDLDAIQSGSFDLLTTVHATYEVYFHTLLSDAQRGRQVIEGRLRRLLDRTSEESAQEAYLAALRVIEKEVYRCTRMNVEPEAVSAERMRPSLYIEGY